MAVADTMPDPMEPLLTSPEAARILGVSPATLRVWRCHGRGPDYIKIGGERGRAMYEPAAIRRWIAARRCSTGNDEA